MAVEIPVHVDIEGAFADAAKRVKVAMMPLEQTIEGLTADLGAWREILNESKINDASFIEAAKNIQRISERLAEADYEMKKYTENEGSIRSMTSTLSELERKWAEMGSAQKYVSGGSKELSADAKTLVQQYKDITAQIQKEGQSLAQLAAEEARINSLRGRGTKIRQTEDRILKSNIQTIQVLSEKYRILSERIQRAPMGSPQFKALSVQLQTVSDQLQRVQNAAKGAETAIASTGTASDKAKASIAATNTVLRTQSGLWTQLKSMAGAYISIFGGLRFADNIRKTTAELELQRIALGSIIQDTSKANDLFREIKAAALKSPFEIKDLVTYTKQLAAYRIETDKLFGVTQRLADVSAGLGVDMNRLILAYGQVRAASVLRGQELRQFTEAGIPLVEKLAEKFRQLGREGTTTADVFELISQRAVPFRMIEEIFDDMTSAGGEFYKMQEKQSETLKGQWMKLKDAVTIMYDEIGNTPQVHKAMEDLIQNALSLTRSWKEVARWIATVGGTLTAYAAVSRATTVASKALTFQEALLVAKEQEQMVVLPKLIQKIVGEAAAKRISVRATMKLTAAQASLRASTGLLERAFWRLRVAMLSNPYAAIAAGIAAVGLAIYTIVKNSEKAEISIESLEEAMSGLRSQSAKTQDALSMIKDYEELSKKADKTADEQKKLERVTRELSKAFPSAIDGIDKETNALQINIDKVRELTEAEQTLAEKRLRATAKEAQDQLPRLEKEREDILDLVKNGRKVDIWGGREQLNSSELAEKEKRLQEITDKIRLYREAIEEVRQLDFVGPLPAPTSEDEKNLATWKKKLKEIHDAKEAEGMPQVFSPDEIKQLGSVYDLWKKTKKGIEEATTAVAAYKSLSLTLTDEDDIKANDKNLKQAEKTLEFWKEVQKSYNFVFKSTSGRDTRLSQLKSDISELTNAYKTFQELRKYKTEEGAIIDINTLFPQLKGEVPSLDYVVSELEKRLEQVKADLKKSPKSKTLLDMKRTLETEISNLRFDDLKDKLEKKLKKVSEEVKRSEAARNFYKDIFDLTGDETLATSLSVEVYGGIGDEFKERLQQQLAALFEGVEVDDAMRNAIDTQDFDYIFANLPEGMEKVREELKKLREDNEKFSAEQIKTWVNELKKAKTYGDERVRIARTTQERIAEINRSNLPDEEKKSLIAQYVERESKEIAKLQYEAFKDSPMYIALFEDLDAASGRMLDNMRKRLVSLRGQWSSLDPVQLKEMQKRMEEIDSSMARRNPFKALSKSIKEYQALLASGRTRKGDEEAAVSAEQNRQAAETNLELALKDLAVKKAAYEQSLKQNGADSTTTTLLYGQMKAANALVDARKKEADAATKSANQAQENANQWSRLSSSVLKSVEAMSTFSVAVQALKKNVHDIVDLFAEMSGSEGLSEAADLLESMAEAAGNAASGLARVLAGDISGAGDLLSAKMSGIQLILQAVNMINNAQLRDWDRQMEEQEKTLTRLQRSYDKLGEAMENAFGSDYLYNYNEQLKNLAAQQEAYTKQLRIQQAKSREASRDEDRKAAADEAENLKQQISDVEKQAKEVTQSMQEFFAGTDLTSAAEAFADSWLDAYREFGDTTGAIKEKMQEMIDNLIVKSVLAGAAKAILEPFFDEIKKLSEANDMTPENVAKLATMLNGKVQDIDASMSSLMTVLQSLGIKTRGQIGSFTGIARDIASASEESILGLAAGINTQNYYMSYVPMIHTNLEQVLALMGGSPTTPTVAPSAAEEGPAMPSVQEMIYDHLPNIDRNLADIKQMLSDVIKPVGTSASKYVATRM